ncbi:MAG TPA: SRPBCC family protein [Ignavibacteriaceae bacterium]|nr:SRPBCC family protein [Ignavibacteriaceae bacterium]
MIFVQIEINRNPVDVFKYIEQLDKHGEWQSAILSAKMEPPGTVHVGTRNIEIRQVPGGPRKIISEIIEYDPPRRISAQGLNGPIRARIGITVESLKNNASSLVTQELELKGYGIGKLIVFFARRSAKEQMSKNLFRLKEILERTETL